MTSSKSMNAFEGNVQGFKFKDNSNIGKDRVCRISSQTGMMTRVGVDGEATILNESNIIKVKLSA